MTKESSLLLLIAIVTLILLGIWRISIFLFSKIYPQYSVQRMRKIVGIAVIVLFIVFISYLFYWLQNYGC